MRVAACGAGISLWLPAMQVFSPLAVLIVKLIALALLLALALLIAVVRWSSAPADAVGEAVAQPIAFSHKHHVGDDGIDCRYCHTSVEQSRSAGLPSTEICLSCHEQLFRDAPLLAPLHASAQSGRPLAWNRVHDLPGFAYFDHSIHIAKGLACADCHGAIESVPLTWRVAELNMQWCLECHRHPEQHVARYRTESGAESRGGVDNVAARVRAKFNLPSTQRLTDCSTCHR